MIHKVLLWNVQDLFVFMDKYKGESLENLSEAKWQLLTASLKNNKELTKVKDLAHCIRISDPDTCLLVEVGGRESLENFNKFFLHDSYTVYHSPSNSDRGIDIGILCKKQFDQSMKFKIHTDKVFARGVAQLNFSPKGGQEVIFLLTHLKSKLNKEGDFEGRTQRQKEVDKLISLYHKCSLNHKIPTFIAGDLNGIIAGKDSDFELTHFANKMRLYDALHWLNKTDFEKTTYIYFPDYGPSHNMQLDYFLVHRDWKHLIHTDSQVLDFNGHKRTQLVTTKEQKFAHPSDHYPVLINLNLS